MAAAFRYVGWAPVSGNSSAGVGFVFVLLHSETRPFLDQVLLNLPWGFTASHAKNSILSRHYKHKNRCVALQGDRRGVEVLVGCSTDLDYTLATLTLRLVFPAIPVPSLAAEPRAFSASHRNIQ